MAEFWILATSFSIVCIIRAAAWLQEACRILRSRGCSCNVEELRSYYQERVDAVLANEANTSYCNYLSFMRICRFDFAVMSFVSMVIISVGWSPQEAFEQATCAIISGTDDFGYILPRCRLMLKLDQLRLVCIYLMVTSFGFLVLVSAQALGTSQEKTTAPDRDAAERIDRTLWIKGLPVRDHRRHRRFLLSDEDFERVTGDLRSAIEDHLAVVEQGALRHTRRSSFWTSQDKNAIETLLVVPVVDQWHNVSMTLRATEERAVSYERWSSGTTHNQVLTWWYRRKHMQCLRKSEGLRRDLLRITLEKKQLSGSAFVTFRTMESRDIILLNELPYRCNKKCLKKGHSLFTFGRPPFSSVTLKTEPAPHPADINWENLHVAFWVRKFRYFFSTGLLIVCMVLVVHPETFKYPPGKGVNRTTANIAAYMEVFLPTVILVVNGLVLPECIYRIALFERSTRKSVSELRQLIQNFFFLALNTFLLLSQHIAIKQVIDGIIADFAKQSPEVLQVCFDKFLLKIIKHEPDQALPYLVNCAFLSNATTLTANWWTRIFQELDIRCCCVTTREKSLALQPFQFAWGYWYAFHLSIFAFALGLCPFIPGTLPITTLYFAIRYQVDKNNFDTGLWDLGSENKGIVLVVVVHLTRIIVGVWWATMGAAFLFYTPIKDQIPISRYILGTSLMVSGIIVSLGSWVHYVEKEKWLRVHRLLAVASNFTGNKYVSFVAKKLRLTSSSTATLGTSTRTIDWDVLQNKSVIWPDLTVEALVETIKGMAPSLADGIIEHLQRGASLSEITEKLDPHCPNTERHNSSWLEMASLHEGKLASFDMGDPSQEPRERVASFSSFDSTSVRPTSHDPKERLASFPSFPSSPCLEDPPRSQHPKPRVVSLDIFFVEDDHDQRRIRNKGSYPGP